MNCFACINACPNNALKIDNGLLCVRLEERSPLIVDEEKCNDCNRCNEVCPMGDIALSGEGCSFCIICMSIPNCILPRKTRASFPNFIASIARFMVLKCKSFFNE